VLVASLLYDNNNNKNPQRYPTRREESGIKEISKKYAPPKPGQWQNEIRTWLEKTKKKRQEDLRKPKGDEERRIPMPYPYIVFGKRPYLSLPDAVALGLPLSARDALDQLHRNQPGIIAFSIRNIGNVPSWTCYIEVYDGPAGFDKPLSDYELRDRRIISLQPHEGQLIMLSWVRRYSTGQMVLVFYDPLLDPRGFSVIEQYNRHIKVFAYYNLD
jgi:hypothetical protein